MGFSLVLFFRDLLRLINEGDFTDEERLNIISELVYKQKECAKECGELPKDE